MKLYHNIQSMTSDCGIAILKSLLSYYNRFSSEYFDSIIKDIDINQGLSLHNIDRILGLHGVEGTSYEVTDINMIKFNNPSILLIKKEKLNHYILVYGMSDKGLIVSDPSLDRISYMSLKELDLVFGGYAYIVERINDFNKLSVEVDIEEFNNLELKNKLELFFLTTIQWMIPLLIVFSLQYLLIYQLRNLTNFQIVAFIISYIGIIGIFCWSRLKLDRIIYEMSFIFKEKETFGFLQEINSRKIEKDNNIYNQLIRFWNNFYASDNIVKVLVMKFDLFYMGVVFVCIFIFSAQIMLLTLGIVILFIIYFIYGRMKRIADNKLLTTKLGKLSVFVEEFIHNRLDRFIFADDNEVDRYCHEILSEIKEIEEKQRKDSSVILTVYDSLMYLNLIAIFAYVVVSFRIVLENSIFSSMIGFLLVYILYGLGKPTVQRALELEKFNTKFPYRKIKKIEQAILGDKKMKLVELYLMMYHLHMKKMIQNIF